MTSITSLSMYSCLNWRVNVQLGPNYFLLYLQAYA